MSNTFRHVNQTHPAKKASGRQRRQFLEQERLATQSGSFPAVAEDTDPPAKPPELVTNDVAE